MSNSSNILKSNFIRFTNANTRVIDTNALVAKKLEGFTSLVREKEDSLNPDFENGGELKEQDSIDLLTEEGGESLEEVVDDSLDMEKIKASCDAMIEEAKANAEGIVGEANANADAIRQDAYETGYKEGLEQAMREYDEKLLELEAIKEEYERAYGEKLLEIEPEMVDVITGVYQHVFGENFYSRRDVMMCLINKALMHIDPGTTVTISVCPDDFEMLIGMKAMLLEKTSLRYEPELIQREDFEKGQAKIETPFGIIDCSVDTELRELTRTLKVLSYERR